MRFSGSRQWREVSKRREILHVSLYLNMHAFLKIKKNIYKTNWLFMGWGTTGTFCLLLEKFLNFPSSHSRRPRGRHSPQRASSCPLPADSRWVKADPACGPESARWERRELEGPAWPAPRRGHEAAAAAVVAKLALASREPASEGRRLTERVYARAWGVSIKLIVLAALSLEKQGLKQSPFTGSYLGMWLRATGMESSEKEPVRKKKKTWNSLSHVDSLRPQGLYSPRNSPGQNTGVGSVPFSRGSSQPRGRTQASRIAGGFFTSWATKEALCGELGSREQKRGESRQICSFLLFHGCGHRGLHPAGTFWEQDSEVNTPGQNPASLPQLPVPVRQELTVVWIPSHLQVLPDRPHMNRVDLHQLPQPPGQKTLRRKLKMWVCLRGHPAQSWLCGEGRDDMWAPRVWRRVHTHQQHFNSRISLHFYFQDAVRFLSTVHLEKEMATHSTVLAWRNPWAEEPGRLRPMGSQVRHDWVTKPPPLLWYLTYNLINNSVSI